MIRKGHILGGLAVAFFGMLSLSSLRSSFNVFVYPAIDGGWNDFNFDAMIQNTVMNLGFDPVNNATNITARSSNSNNNNITTKLSSSSSSITLFDSTSNTTMQRRPVPLPKHDKSSLTSYMWLKGKPFKPQLDERPSERASAAGVVIDAVSIGSQFNVAQMEGQAASWGSHWSMRYLFGTTEQDDAHPTCHLNLTDRQFMGISDRCQTKVQYGYNRLRGIRSHYPREKWIAEQGKTKGWLCAQQRFAHAVGKVGRFYRREGVKSLPDFFFIQDDDTWYGMNKLLKFFSTHNQSRPYTTAGCTVRWPIQLVNFTFPWGGFGTMMNRHSLERLIKPIYCNETSTDPHTELVCFRIKENLVGEKMAFQDGMSVSDLMDRHAAMHPYVEYRKWSDPGYCMLGDWVIGHYINNYGIGSHEDAVLDYVHTDISLGYLYKMPGRGSCRNQNVMSCRRSKTQYMCHRMKPDDMFELNAIDAKKKSGY
mmetsp:Transcript_8124/g.13457  ORF Transcript_8124/g.13457 Transcript_8124/m.13457 type:complete len:479 (-) Transcript_8124:113-1549(-)